MRRNSPVYRELVLFKKARERLLKTMQTAQDEDATNSKEACELQHVKNTTSDPNMVEDIIFKILERKTIEDTPTKAELKLRKEELCHRYRRICEWIEKSADNKQALPISLPSLAY